MAKGIYSGKINHNISANTSKGISVAMENIYLIQENLMRVTGLMANNRDQVYYFLMTIHLSIREFGKRENFLNSVPNNNSNIANVSFNRR